MLSRYDVKRLERLNKLKKKIEQQIRIEQDNIVNYYEQFISDAYDKKADSFGIVHVENVEFNVPKSVSYDQGAMARLYDNKDARKFITAKFGVSETLYKSLPDNIKTEFAKHRTVKPGKIALKIKGE